MPQSSLPECRLDRLLALLARDPTNIALRRDALRESLAADNLQAAIALVDDTPAVAVDPELDALSGLVLLQAGRAQDAERVLGRAVQCGLQAPAVQYNLAYALALQARHEEALRALEDDAVVAGVPSSLLLRARCLHHLQRHDEAVAACQAHLALAPDDAATHGLLGLLLHEQGRAAESQEHVAAALRQDPSQLEAMLALAGLQRGAEDPDAARLSYEGLLVAHPNCGRGWQGLAMVDLHDLALDAARGHIEQALRYIPEHIGSWHILAWIHVMRGDAVAAEIAFEQAMAIDRNFAETHGGLAVIAALRGSEGEARGSIRRALKLDPECMSVQYAELLLLLRHDKREEAQALIDAFLRRPATGDGVLFRDLMTAQIRHLEQRGRLQDPPVLH